MKALQIALLVIAGAMAGAVAIKVWPMPALQRIEAPPGSPRHTGASGPAAGRAGIPRLGRRTAADVSGRGVCASHGAGVRTLARAFAGSQPGTPDRPPTPPARTEPENVTPVPPPPPESHRVTLNAGLLLPVRLVEGLSTERNGPGDIFHATLVNELVAGDFVIAERGARVEGPVVASGPGC